ncbi:MgtC/SapB family protein [Martelella alba]|uniref:Protein MgtC n=1 Tax=Martelella alba TaxID=2590451 RepID=A0A506U2Q5_9HYPH|nr:MgtC/SapB family protein [Martelella alba]TPW26859.1 MgtC/SapB family protein [Martelella alba]
MSFLDHFQLFSILDSTMSLIVAFICGTAIGAERQYRQRSAGLRTNALVAIGAAAFVDIGQAVGGNVEAVRVISYVVSGIGFLGAGVIMKDGLHVRGLNTAATLWCSAAAGASAGADLVAEAILITLIVLAANTLLHPLVDRVNRMPLKASQGEAVFVIRAVVSPEDITLIRRRIIEFLNKAKYPVRDIEVEDRPNGDLEIGATLVSSAVVLSELDKVVADIGKAKAVKSVYWENGIPE